MRSDADIVIIGAGFAGAATAYHLRKRGFDRVLILEREAVPDEHSSGRNAAIVREQIASPILQPFMSKGAAFLRRGELATFVRRGLMLLGGEGLEASRFFPRIRGTGTWYPEDGTVDVAALLQAYLRDQRVEFGTIVDGWRRSGEAMCVDTNRGVFSCRLVVNAAGAWAGTLGAIPLTPMNRHLFVSAPMSWIPSDLPAIWDTAVGLYFRPESGGLLLSSCDETPAPPGDYGDDPSVLDDLAKKLKTTQPGLSDLSIRTAWVGQRTFAPDRNFVIGFDPRDAGVFHVAGLGGHGVTASDPIGERAARLIDAGPPERPDALSPARLLTRDSANADSLVSPPVPAPPSTCTSRR